MSWFGPSKYPSRLSEMNMYSFLMIHASSPAA
jgi:hypothetical protein